MESLFTSCFVFCHRCGHEWTYMGIRMESLKRSKRPVTVNCPQCRAKVKMDAKNAR